MRFFFWNFLVLAPGWLALPDMGGQPSQHFFAFLLAPDFHGPAVLLAFPLSLAELRAEGGELVPVHHIDLIVGGDIGPEVAVGALHIEVPDIVISFQTFTKGAAHKGEGRGLDRNQHFAGFNVRTLVICPAVMGGAVHAHIGRKCPFPGIAISLGGNNVSHSEGLHLKQPLSLISGIIIAPFPGIVNTKSQISPCANYTNVGADFWRLLCKLHNQCNLGHIKSNKKVTISNNRLQSVFQFQNTFFKLAVSRG